MPEKGLFNGNFKGLGSGLNEGTYYGVNKGLYSNNSYNFQQETMAWYNQLTLPKPSMTYLLSVDYLIKQFKSTGIWPFLDRFWIFATEQQAHARVSIVNPKGINSTWPSNITEQSSPSWARLRGYTGNGSSSYLLSNYNPSTSDAVSYKLNSGSLGVYLIGTESDIYATPMGGYIGTSPSNYIRLCTPVWSPGLGKYYYAWNINDSTQSSLVLSTSQSPVTGLFSATRINSSTTALYRNGNLITTYSANSSSIPNLNIPIMAVNDNGTFTAFSSNTYAMAYICSASSAAGALLIYNIFQTFAMQSRFYV